MASKCRRAVFAAQVAETSRTNSSSARPVAVLVSQHEKTATGERTNSLSRASPEYGQARTLMPRECCCRNKAGNNDPWPKRERAELLVGSISLAILYRQRGQQFGYRSAVLTCILRWLRSAFAFAEVVFQRIVCVETFAPAERLPREEIGDPCHCPVRPPIRGLADRLDRANAVCV